MPRLRSGRTVTKRHQVTRLVVMRELLEQSRHVMRVGSRVVTAATASLGIASLLLSTACYTYEARTSNDIPANQHVVATLNNRGRVALTPAIGDDAATLEGDMVSATADTIHMRLDQAAFLSGTTSNFGGMDVTVPTDGITVLDTKQFSSSKTAALVVIAAAAIVGAIRAFGLLGTGGAGKDTKPPNPPASN